MCKKKKTIYIAIETKPRELNSQVLLAYFASKLGYRVYIGTFEVITDLLIHKKKKAGIYHYKGVERFNQIQSRVNVLTRIDQEIGPALNLVDEVIKFRVSDPLNNLLNSYYTVGPEATLSAKKHLSHTNVNIVETGWPRIDLWRREFEVIYKKDVTLYQSKFGKFILFSSDFGFVNPDRIKSYEQQLEGAELKLKNQLLGNAVKAHDEYKLFLCWLRKIDAIEDFPNIVIRPHPSEDKKVWKRDLGLLKKVHVVYEGEVSSWIHASIGVLHRGCTSGLQAYMSGIPVCYVVLDPNTESQTLPCLVSKQIYTLEGLIEWITNIQNPGIKNINKFDYGEIINQKIKYNSKLAVENILDDFERYAVVRESRLTLVILEMWFKYTTTILIRILKATVRREFKRRLLSIHPYELDKLQNGIKAKDVKNVLRSINALFDNNHVGVRKTVLKNLVVIEKNR